MKRKLLIIVLMAALFLVPISTVCGEDISWIDDAHEVYVQAPFMFNVKNIEGKFLGTGEGEASKRIKIPARILSDTDIGKMRLRLKGLPEDIEIGYYGITEDAKGDDYIIKPGLFIKTTEVKYDDFESLKKVKETGWDMRMVLDIEMYSFDAPIQGLAIIDLDAHIEIEYVLDNKKSRLSTSELGESFKRRYLPDIDKVFFASVGKSQYTYSGGKRKRVRDPRFLFVLST